MSCVLNCLDMERRMTREQAVYTSSPSIDLSQVHTRLPARNSVFVTSTEHSRLPCMQSSYRNTSCGPSSADPNDSTRFASLFNFVRIVYLFPSSIQQQLCLRAVNDGQAVDSQVCATRHSTSDSPSARTQSKQSPPHLVWISDNKTLNCVVVVTSG